MKTININIRIFKNCVKTNLYGIIFTSHDEIELIDFLENKFGYNYIVVGIII